MIITDQKQLIIPSEQAGTKEAKLIIRDLWLELDKHRNCVGLAAIQIGCAKKVFVVHFQNIRYEFVNPYYATMTPNQFNDIEGCLSIPDKEFYVRRSESVCIVDDFGGMRTFNGMLSRIVQHEMDHLSGRTLLQTGSLMEPSRILF